MCNTSKDERRVKKIIRITAQSISNTPHIQIQNTAITRACSLSLIEIIFIFKCMTERKSEIEETNKREKENFRERGRIFGQFNHAKQHRYTHTLYVPQRNENTTKSSHLRLISNKIM